MVRVLSAAVLLMALVGCSSAEAEMKAADAAIREALVTATDVQVGTGRLWWTNSGEVSAVDAYGVAASCGMKGLDGVVLHLQVCDAAEISHCTALPAHSGLSEVDFFRVLEAAHVADVVEVQPLALTRDASTTIDVEGKPVSVDDCYVVLGLPMKRGVSQRAEVVFIDPTSRQAIHVGRLDDLRQ